MFSQAFVLDFHHFASTSLQICESGIIRLGDVVAFCRVVRSFAGSVDAGEEFLLSGDPFVEHALLLMLMFMLLKERERRRVYTNASER